MDGNDLKWWKNRDTALQKDRMPTKQTQQDNLLKATLHGWHAKHHKEGNPLRPIVTCTNSTLYNTSRFLTEILSPLQNKNGFSLKNSSQFSKEMANLSINKDDVMVSFDVISLFTAIPVTKACTYIKSKLQRDPTLPLRTNLTVDDIISLLEFTLSNNYFIYNGDTYRQLHGCAMGSPVSPAVANLCMEEIKEAINIAKVKPKIWKCYLDDGFCIINSNAVASFHDNLKSIDPDIDFTVEHKKHNQLPFLNTLVTRQNDQIKIDV